jgi:hypothetical protein
MKPSGRSMCRWENNITMDLKKIGCQGVEWIDLAQNRVQVRAVVNMVINLKVP